MLVQDRLAEADEVAEDGIQQEAEDASVYCANLVYADGKSSVCFSDEFLKVADEETHIQVDPDFVAIDLDSVELFDHPFAVMTGEGSFDLTEEQISNLRDYLSAGGFLLASAGCSSESWNDSFRDMMDQAFPDAELKRLDAEHPIYHSVYDITRSNYKSGGPRLPHFEALTIDGRVVLVWSPDGLNDTASAGIGCCCCGGNEIKSALKLNVNLRADALTH